MHYAVAVWVWSWDGANSIGYPIARGNLPVDTPTPQG